MITPPDIQTRSPADTFADDLSDQALGKRAADLRQRIGPNKYEVGAHEGQSFDYARPPETSPQAAVAPAEALNPRRVRTARCEGMARLVSTHAASFHGIELLREPLEAPSVRKIRLDVH